MSTRLVMTIIGPDRPGLVESVAGIVTAHGGNWLESRMARLAGQFAGIVEFDVPRDTAEGVTSALRRLSDRGLQVVVQAGGSEPAAKPHRRVHLDLLGGDRPGILHHLTEVLAAHSVNIEELTTELRTAPMTGQPLFAANAELLVPEPLTIDELRRALEAIAADLMVEIIVAEEPARNDT